MNKIYFNNNEFTPLSDEVKTAMKTAIDKFADANPKGFGQDYRSEAEIDDVKIEISEKLNANSYHFFFTNGFSQSILDLFNFSILYLDVELIITSIFESKTKLEYLKQLKKRGKINLYFVETTEFGEIELGNLKQLLEENKRQTLVSFSHANSFTGVLLPVKDIASVAKQYNAYFHLDSSLMIGNYKIDLSRIEVDFFSFNANLINGPVGIAAMLVNEQLATDNERYFQLKSSFRSVENRNIALIFGFKTALLQAFVAIKEKQKVSHKLKDCFREELKNKLQLGTLDFFLKKKGLFNQLAFFASKEEFGNYLIENLDRNGFIVGNWEYPIEINKMPDSHFINLSFSINFTKKMINTFITFLQSLQKK